MLKRVALLSALVLATPTFAGWGGPSVLKGLRRSNVLIEKLEPDSLEVGLTVDRLRTLVELRLRRMGVQVVPGNGGPGVYLQVTGILGSNGLFSYGLELEVMELATVQRTKRTEGVIVWRDSYS